MCITTIIVVAGPAGNLLRVPSVRVALRKVTRELRAPSTKYCILVDGTINMEIAGVVSKVEITIDIALKCSHHQSSIYFFFH